MKLLFKYESGLVDGGPTRADSIMDGRPVRAGAIKFQLLDDNGQDIGRFVTGLKLAVSAQDNLPRVTIELLPTAIEIEYDGDVDGMDTEQVRRLFSLNDDCYYVPTVAKLNAQLSLPDNQGGQ